MAMRDPQPVGAGFAEVAVAPDQRILGLIRHGPRRIGPGMNHRQPLILPPQRQRPEPILDPRRQRGAQPTGQRRHPRGLGIAHKPPARPQTGQGGIAAVQQPALPRLFGLVDGIEQHPFVVAHQTDGPARSGHFLQAEQDLG